MLDALDITEAEAAGLSELAALDLATARRFTERAHAAEDPDEANRLARTAQRAARSYRQFLLLKVRLKRALAEHAREHPQVRDEAAVARRMATVRRAVARVAWAEREACEGPDDERDELFDDLVGGLVEGLARRAPDETFERAPIDEAVVELALELGLSEACARAWRDLPDPPPEATAFLDDLDPPWRGSG